MYKTYDYMPIVLYGRKLRKKMIPLLLSLPEDDPIRIWQDRFLFSYFCKKRKIQSEEERKKYFLERMVRVVPGLKEVDDIEKKLVAYSEWFYRPKRETLDGNKLLAFLEQHNIDPYLFMYVYGDMLDFSDFKYGRPSKRKGYRKLFNLYRETQRHIFGERFVEGWPKFENDEDEE